MVYTVCSWRLPSSSTLVLVNKVIGLIMTSSYEQILIKNQHNGQCITVCGSIYHCCDDGVRKCTLCINNAITTFLSFAHNNWRCMDRLLIWIKVVANKNQYSTYTYTLVGRFSLWMWRLKHIAILILHFGAYQWKRAPKWCYWYKSMPMGYLLFMQYLLPVVCDDARVVFLFLVYPEKNCLQFANNHR